MRKPDSPHDLLLQLYRLSHTSSLQDFQDDALALLRTVVPFDAAMWGTAEPTPEGIDVHTLHLHQKAPEMMQAYEEVKHLDTAPHSMYGQGRCTRGFSAEHWFHRPHERSIRDFLRRYDQAHLFITLDHVPDTSWAHWITLFRADPQAQTRREEVRRLDMVSAHLMQALHINQRLHLDSLRSARASHAGVGMADLRGHLYQHDALFAALLACEWPGWRGPQLPQALMQALQQGKRQYQGRQLVWTAHTEHGLLWLRARAREAADGLAPREAEVAQLVARGLSHKQIAQQLGNAPATVRSQIRAIYHKLGISSVAQLVDALRQAD